MSKTNDRAEALFEAALGLETDAQRAEYLRRACPDSDLRRDVESRLAAHRKQDNFHEAATVCMAPAATDAPLEGTGRLIGGYRIVRPLGKGGMGVVYEAIEIESGRRVALKVLSHGMDSPLARQRFRREGLLAASVNHPNTVYVFGTDEIDGQPVIAMELVGGGTLQERVQLEGPMAVTDAVDAILQVIAGLEGAAALGVLHRDIKPSNCFVETDGTVKVGDFGLSISSAGTGESKLTMEGSFLGTPAYSPPEQVRGDEFTVQGDIYAVGVTLYYLLTGRTPFEGEDMVRILASVLERPAESPAKLRPELPHGLCGVVLRCLEKQPTKRFRSYAGLRNALVPFCAEAPAPASIGLRFLAGFIDWAVLGAVSVSMPLLSTGQWDALFHPDSYPGTRLFVATASFFLALLYFAVLEGLFGASIGKRICGLRVAGADRGLPGVPRALLRAIIAQGLPALVPLLALWLSIRPWGGGGSESALLVAALLFCTARRRNGFAAVQDLLSRTRVLRRPAHEARPGLEESKDRPVMAQAATQFGPYRVLATPHQGDSEDLVLGFDERLRRKVWIRTLEAGAPPVAPSLRNLARVGRLRWLNGKRSPAESWDAYEAGPGKSLLDLITRRQPWIRVRFWLLDLAEELVAAAKDNSMPSALALDRVWITSEGRAKLLDFPVPSDGKRRDRSGTPAAVIHPGEGVTDQQFLGQVAVAALEGRDVNAHEARSGSVAVPLPPHAREVLGELQRGLSPALLAERLRPVLQKPAFVSTGRRAGLIAGCFALPLAVAVIWGALVAVLITLSQTQADAISLSQCLNRMADPKAAQESAGGIELENQKREAFEVYIAGRFRGVITNRATWTSLFGSTILRDQRSAAEQLIARRPVPTEIELKRAAAVVEPYLKENLPIELVNPFGKFKPEVLVYGVAWTLVFGSALPALLAALFFRGGLVLRILGLTIVKEDGTEASRLRIFWRWMVAWGPLSVLAFLTTWVPTAVHGFSWRHAALMIIGALPAVGLIVWAALRPDRGLHDRVAGTCLVPRE